MPQQSMVQSDKLIMPRSQRGGAPFCPIREVRTGRAGGPFWPTNSATQPRKDVPMNAVEDRPLITFFVTAYNQEGYIRQAVEGAFSQTYSPLEIILSDDCSDDHSFDIMREMAAHYSGPHRIILNRNKFNFGLARHINHIVDTANGRIMVLAAGDDISMPEGTQYLYEAFRNNKKAFSVHSSCIIIDRVGNETRILRDRVALGSDALRQVALSTNPGVVGCTHAWRKEVFNVFGPINERILLEDRAIPFRSLILGEIFYIDHPLVKYRRHGENASDYEVNDYEKYVCYQRRLALNYLALQEQYVADLRKAREWKLIAEDVYGVLSRALQKEMRKTRLNYDLWAERYWERIYLLARSARYFTGIPAKGKTLLRILLPFVYKAVWQRKANLRPSK